MDCKRQKEINLRYFHYNIIKIITSILFQAKDVETTLKNVPHPIEAQVVAVEKLITDIVEEMKVTPDMMRTRKEVVKELNKLLAAKVEGWLFFSCVLFCGMCFSKTDYITVDLCCG